MVCVLVGGNVTTSETDSKQEKAPFADTTKTPIVTESSLTANPVSPTGSLTHERDKNELPGIDPFA